MTVGGFFFVGERQLNWPVCGYACVRVGGNEEGVVGAGVWARETDWYIKS
jgi:hypothetical protein